MRQVALVSIIIPVYNAEKYLKATITSVIEQTYNNWEILLIVDANSNDNSFIICEAFSKQDDRIKVFRGIGNGVAANRNLGLEKISGEFVCFLDADDLWLKDKLAVQLNYALFYTVSFVYSSFGIISEAGEFSKSIRIAKSAVGSKDLLKDNCIGCSTVMISRKLIGAKRFVEGHHEDLDFWIRVLGSEDKAYPIREVLSLYRVFEGSRSANKFDCAIWRWELLKKYKLSLGAQLHYMLTYISFAFLKRSFFAYCSRYKPHEKVFSEYNHDENTTVSVIMTAFNSVETIEAATRSVLDQTYTNIELIVIDDGSSDGTLDVVKKITDDRLRVFSMKESIGAAKARNRYIDFARGRYIAFLNADDIWLKFKVSLQLENMRVMSSPFSFSAYNVIDCLGKIVGGFHPKAKVTYRDLLYGNVIGCSTVIYDRSYFGTAKFLPLQKRQDFALWLVMLKRCYFASSLPVVTASLRGGPKRLSLGTLEVLKYQWNIYREVEGYSKISSSWYFLGYILNSTLKYFYSYRRISPPSAENKYAKI